MYNVIQQSIKFLRQRTFLNLYVFPNTNCTQSVLNHAFLRTKDTENKLDTRFT